MAKTKSTKTSSRAAHSTKAEVKKALAVFRDKKATKAQKTKARAILKNQK